MIDKKTSIIMGVFYLMRIIKMDCIIAGIRKDDTRA